jgi:hypothetical protein
MQKKVYDDTQKILGKLELEDIVRWAINRCNTTAGDPFLFNRNVEMLMNMLPANRLAEIQGMEKDYVDVVEQDVFKYSRGGRQIGSAQRPFYLNTPDDPNYDHTKPAELWSPIRMKVKIKNYDKLYTIVLRLLENSGLTWRNENVEIEGGKVDFDDEPQTDIFTPTYEDEKK